MIVRVGDDGTVGLLEAEDLRHFSVAMPNNDAARAALATVARLDGPEYAWISPEQVRALAGPVPPGWNDQFAATIAFAASKVWTDADGALRAHIVYE